MSFKNSPIKSLIIHIIQKGATYLGCVLFLVSILFPFYCDRYFPMGTQTLRSPPYRLDYYYSFKMTIEYHAEGWGRPGPGWHDAVITDNWLYEKVFYEYYAKPGIPYVLILILTFQILTLTTAIASAFFGKRVFSLSAVITCSVIIGLMTFVSLSPSRPNTFFYSYQPGYWLTYPSMILFLLAFILSLIAKKKRTTDAGDIGTNKRISFF